MRNAAFLLLALTGLPVQGRIASRTILQATRTLTGQALEFPQRADEVVAIVGTLKTRGQTGSTTFHFPAAISVLSGTLTLAVPGKPARTIRTGEAAVPPVGIAVTLSNKGGVLTRFIAVAFAEEGKPALESAGAGREFTVDTVLETTTTWAGEPMLFPAGANQLTVLATTVPPGAVIAKHTHAHTQFVYMLEGEHSVEPSGHPRHSFSAGSAMIETREPHIGTNAGHDPDRFITVFAGKAGVPLSTPVH